MFTINVPVALVSDADAFLIIRVCIMPKNNTTLCHLLKNYVCSLVSGPTPNKALFKELVAPPWGI